MRILGYPELDRHIEEHRQFNAEIYDLAQKSLRTKGNVSREMIKVFQKWQREHIMKSDRRYADYFLDSAPESAKRPIDRILPRAA
jgi:hemerythrin-like metal-binding protein